MYELIQTGSCSYYINCPAKIGIYAPTPDSVYLIDSGSDKDAGRKVRRILETQGWTLKGIINTHSHADHIGGNAYLQSNTGCPVFSGGIEGDFTRHPLLEPSYLFGGFPPKELRHKFLLAKESAVFDFDHPDFPGELEIIPLPGHSFDMCGFRTPDGTVFLADCLSSRETLEKYAVPFIFDVGAYLDTLDKVMELKAPMFVPAHAPASPEICELAEFNRKKVLDISHMLLDICQEPICFEDILKATFERCCIVMDHQQHALVGSTVRSFLAWLSDNGQVKSFISDNYLLWQTQVS